MSAADWIMLSIHPDDESILAISGLTGEDRHTLVGRCVAWFRWIDQHLNSASTTIKSDAINLMVGAQAPREKFLDFASALEKVGWIKTDESGFVRVSGYAKYFSKSAKQRFLANRRAAKFRSRNSNADRNARITRKSHPEEKRREDINTLPLPLKLDTENFQAAWAEWLAFRKEIRKPVRVVSAKRQLRDFEIIGPEMAAAQIRQSIKNGWTGLFEIKDGGRKNANGNGKITSATEWEKQPYFPG